jgi:hypothetical protein
MSSDANIVAASAWLQKAVIGDIATGVAKFYK